MIDRLGVLDVIPTLDLWTSLRGVDGVFGFHLFLLAQSSDLPERMIAADPNTFIGRFLDTWVRSPSARPADVRAVYLTAARRPEVIDAICPDYRASSFVDHRHDAADRRAGRRITVPVLPAWPDLGTTPLPFDPDSVWRAWPPICGSEY